MVAIAKKEAGSRMTAGMGDGPRAEKMCLQGSLWRQKDEPRMFRIGETLRGLRQQVGLWEFPQSQWEFPRWQNSEWEKGI